MPRRRLVSLCVCLLLGWWACAAPLPALEGLACQADAECGEGAACSPQKKCRARCPSGSCAGPHRTCIDGLCVPQTQEAVVEKSPETPADEPRPQETKEPPQDRSEPRAEPVEPRAEPSELQPDASEVTPERNEPTPEVVVEGGCLLSKKPDCPYSGPPGTKEQPPCQAGTPVCQSGAWTCVGEVLPKPEDCNNKDDDCDGEIDQGFGLRNDPKGPPCYYGKNELGRCRIGRYYCNNGSWVCSESYTLQGQAETCNGLDDDCDGEIDEDTTKACVKTLAGPDPAHFDGNGANAILYDPVAMVKDPSTGWVYISERNGHRIRRYEPTSGNLVTVLGGSIAGAKDGYGDQATLRGPAGLVIDDENRLLYIADSRNHSIRVLSLLDGTVQLFAGNGSPGYQPQPAGSTKLTGFAAFDVPSGVSLSTGALWIADTNNHALRVIRNGKLETAAGPSTPATPGYIEGDAAKARFRGPLDVHVSPQNLPFVADTNNHVVRLLQTGARMTRLQAGSAGNAGFKDGDSGVAQFNLPFRLGTGTVSTYNLGKVLLIADFANDAIRRVPFLQTLTVKTLIGPASTSPEIPFDMSRPTAVLGVQKDEIWFIERRAIVYKGNWNTTPWKVEEVVGQDTKKQVNAKGKDARFIAPMGIVADGDNLYVVDGQRIRHIDSSADVGVMFGSASAGLRDQTRTSNDALLEDPRALALHADSSGSFLYITQDNGVLRRYNVSTKETQTLIGVGNMGNQCAWATFRGGAKFRCTELTGGASDRKTVSQSQGIALTPNGDMYISDTERHRVMHFKRVANSTPPAYTTSVLAGKISVPGTSDGIQGVARFNQPKGLAYVRTNNIDYLLVVDSENHCIRQIELDSKKVTTLAGRCGIQGWIDGAGAAARFRSPIDGVVALEGGGPVLYITDGGNASIRRVDASGKVTTITGTPPTDTYPPLAGYANGLLKTATTGFQTFLTQRKAGELIIADTDNRAIRAVLLP